MKLKIHFFLLFVAITTAKLVNQTPVPDIRSIGKKQERELVKELKEKHVKKSDIKKFKTIIDQAHKKNGVVKPERKLFFRRFFRRIFRAIRRVFDPVYHRLRREYDGYYRKSPLLKELQHDFCLKKCNRDHCGEVYNWHRSRSQYCRKCKQACKHGAAKIYISRVGHMERSMFRRFYWNPALCSNRTKEVLALCRKSHCDQSYSKSCMICIRDGNKGALQGCHVPIAPDANRNNLFARLFNAFNYNKRHCSICSRFKNEHCSALCRGRGRSCLSDCYRISMKACMATCIGYKKDFIKRFVDPKITRIVNERREVCGSCGATCNVHRQAVCFNRFSACDVYYNKFCNHRCNHRYCPSYRKNWMHRKRIKGWQLYAYKKNTEIQIKRMQSRQALRNKYDASKKYKLQQAVLRYNRDSIYDSLKLMEGTIYKEQEKLVNDLREKEEQREEEIQDRIEAAYADFKSLKKVTDEEILIFEE